jgi:hypothetical protein
MSYKETDIWELVGKIQGTIASQKAWRSSEAKALREIDELIKKHDAKWEEHFESTKKEVGL